MIQLTNEQIEKRDYNFSRFKGRIAVIDNPYMTNIPPGAKITIYSYSPEKEMFRVVYADGRQEGYCYRDEFNLIDKEFSDFKIIKKGIRTERKDKFGDRFMIELLNNKRDIYLSTALASLLNLNDEENYVGFGADPDTGAFYIFKADKISGYLFNKTNNRITSTADWRELYQIYGKPIFEITPRPIIDNENPGFIFYTLNPSYENFENGKNVTNNQFSTPKQNNKVKKEVFYEDNGFIYGGDTYKHQEIQPIKYSGSVELPTNWSDVAIKFETQSNDPVKVSATTNQVYSHKEAILEELQKTARASFQELYGGGINQIKKEKKDTNKSIESKKLEEL